MRRARRVVTLVPVVLVAAGVVLVSACKRGEGGPLGADLLAGLPGCGSSKELFTTLPVAQNQISGWVPLGNLNPPGHTFPTDHQYIYIVGFGNSGAPPVPLVAPGSIVVTRGRLSRYSNGSPSEDYSLEFSRCRETHAEFGHVRTVSASLLTQLGPFDQQCNTYSPNPGLSVTLCFTKSVAVNVNAGEQLGTTAGLDLSLLDNRITPITYANPSRWTANPDGFDHFHVVPFSDYFAEPVRTTVQSLLGSFDGRVKRTVPPIGGTIATDVPGTAQGAWMNPAQPTYPEDRHFAIVPDNVDPTVIDISTGLSLPFVSSNTYQMRPVSSGLVNRDPSQITADGRIYCYDLQQGFGAMLLQLVDATTLKVEGRLGSSNTCAAQQPWAFTVFAFTFRR